MAECKRAASNPPPSLLPAPSARPPLLPPMITNTTGFDVTAITPLRRGKGFWQRTGRRWHDGPCSRPAGLPHREAGRVGPSPCPCARCCRSVRGQVLAEEAKSGPRSRTSSEQRPRSSLSRMVAIWGRQSVCPSGCRAACTRACTCIGGASVGWGWSSMVLPSTRSPGGRGTTGRVKWNRQCAICDRISVSAFGIEPSVLPHPARSMPFPASVQSPRL